ncbi:MAG: hypothetical protein KDA81_20685, partial [Planctomycetaceae bacterium]|nr:hypothetical protein [Planctomycetaceae bacterium]
MKVLPVIRRTVRLCLLAALLAGGVALYVWSQSDQLVRKELVKRFDQVAPELMLVVGDVDVRSAKRTVLRDIEILDRKKLRPVFR